MKQASSSAKKTVFVVDDDRNYLELVKELLGPHYHVVCSHNGEEALSTAQRIRPDLIVLDIGMPKMDGFAFFDRITPLKQAPIYPVLIVSAREHLRDIFKTIPVKGFLVKPFHNDEFVNTIKKILSEKKSPDADQTPKHSKQILIIDNDLNNITAMATSFLSQGHTVTLAKTTKVAIQKILDPDFPDLILIKQGTAEQPEHIIPYHLRGMRSARNVNIIVYTEDFKKIDLATNDLITKTVGEKNFLEIKDLDNFLQKLTLILDEQSPNPPKP